MFFYVRECFFCIDCIDIDIGLVFVIFKDKEGLKLIFIVCKKIILF